jgi:hypothetical protein
MPTGMGLSSASRTPMAPGTSPYFNGPGRGRCWRRMVPRPLPCPAGRSSRSPRAILRRSGSAVDYNSRPSRFTGSVPRGPREKNWAGPPGTTETLPGGASLGPRGPCRRERALGPPGTALAGRGHGPPGTAGEKLGWFPGDHRYTFRAERTLVPGGPPSGNSHGPQGHIPTPKRPRSPGGPCRRERALGPPGTTETSPRQASQGPPGTALAGRGHGPPGTIPPGRSRQLCPLCVSSSSTARAA